MNISDVKIDYSIIQMDLITEIFYRQRELMKLYKMPKKLDLDLPADQQILRSLAWCVIEEAAEAIDVCQRTKPIHKEHLGDEIADMTHFYIEFLILSGLDAGNLFRAMSSTNTPELIHHQNTYGDQESSLDSLFRSFTVEFALSVNILKNRFWRESNLKTDQEAFKKQLYRTIPLFFDFISRLGITIEELIDFYFRKNEVNLFRIRSKY